MDVPVDNSTQGRRTKNKEQSPKKQTTEIRYTTRSLEGQWRNAENCKSHSNTRWRVRFWVRWDCCHARWQSLWGVAWVVSPTGFPANSGALVKPICGWLFRK